MKAVQRILFAIVFLLVFLVFKAPVFAQGNIPTTTNYQTRDLNVWSQNVVFEVMSAFSCQLAGVNFSHRDQKCLGFDPKTGKLGFVDNGGGALGLLTGGIAMLYTPPANTGNYVSYLSQNFGISKPTYAQSQGVGFDSINPLIGVWAVFRDISYLLFIFVFIIIGVAIMLRAKIDPRTVMTIQNQIPKLIIGIIMVTLSFAIAGLLIDLMWASTYVVINVIGRANNNISISKTTTQLNNHTLGFFDQTLSYGNQDTDQGMGGLFNLAQKGSGSVQETINSSFGQSSPPNEDSNYAQCNTGDLVCNGLNFVGSLANNTVQGVANVANGTFKLITLQWGDLASNIFAGVVSGVLGYLVSWLIGGIAFFIIIILLLWNLFKLWLFLLKCYIGILVDIIFAPFWILGGLIPGASSLGFTGWLKDLLGNLAVFPATVGVFLLAKLFVDISDTAKAEFFVPPLIGNFAGGIYTLGPLIALGFVLAAPHVAEGVKKSFKEKFSIDLSGAGESIKAAQGMGIALMSTTRAKLYKEYVDQKGTKTYKGLLRNPVLDTKRFIAKKGMDTNLGKSRTLRRVMDYLSRDEEEGGGSGRNQDPTNPRPAPSGGGTAPQAPTTPVSTGGTAAAPPPPPQGHTTRASGIVVPTHSQGATPNTQPAGPGPTTQTTGQNQQPGGGVASAIQVENSRQDITGRLRRLGKLILRRKP